MTFDGSWVSVIEAVLCAVFGISLILASEQDFKTRTVSLQLTWFFIGLTAAGYALHGYWAALIGYAVFMGWSFFLYDFRIAQIGGGATMIVTALILSATNVISIEATTSLTIMGALWVLAFISPARGEADYNVLFTCLALLKPDGFMVYVLSMAAIYFLLIIIKLVNRSRKTNKNYLEIVYGLYFKLTDAKYRDDSLKMNIKKLYPDAPDTEEEVAIPLIPILAVTFLISLFVQAAVSNSALLLTAGGIMGITMAACVTVLPLLKRKKG